MLRFFKNAQPLCLAHRGASSLAPENTLVAGEIAAAQGAHGWEVDIRLSADHVPVLMHDDTLARTTDVALRSEFKDRKPWHVCEFTWQELQTLDAGSWFHVQDPYAQVAADQAISEKECAAQRIPSLQQAILLSQRLGLGLNIELKGADPKGPPQPDGLLVQAATAVIRELQAQEICLYSSFSIEILEDARNLAPDIPRGLLLNKRNDSLESLEILLGDLHAAALHPRIGVLTDEEQARFLRDGFLVNVWVANTLREMRRLADLGVSGIVTDYPQLGPGNWGALGS